MSLKSEEEEAVREAGSGENVNKRSRVKAAAASQSCHTRLKFMHAPPLPSCTSVRVSSDNMYTSSNSSSGRSRNNR